MVSAAITPVFSHTIYDLDDLEIIVICWFGAQETFLIIINDEKLCFLIFLWELWYIFIFDEEKVQKNSIYLKEKSFVTL